MMYLLHILLFISYIYKTYVLNIIFIEIGIKKYQDLLNNKLYMIFNNNIIKNHYSILYI